MTLIFGNKLGDVCMQTASGGGSATTATAWFFYMQYVDFPITVAYVEGLVHPTNTNSGQTAEIGLFSTPLPPQRGVNQIMTKLSANTVTDMTVAGPIVVRNVTPFSQVVGAGTFLWCGIRSASGTGIVNMGVGGDSVLSGAIQTLASAPALTSQSTFAATIKSFSAGIYADGVIAPRLRYTLV